MSLEIEATLVQVLEKQNGNSEKGPWTKHAFVVNTMEQFPKKVCFMAWNDKGEPLYKAKPGDRLKIAFSPESREYQNKWYTDLRAYRIEILSTAPGTVEGTRSTEEFPTFPTVENLPASESFTAMPDDSNGSSLLNLNETDDLPF